MSSNSPLFRQSLGFEPDPAADLVSNYLYLSGFLTEFDSSFISFQMQSSVVLVQ